MLKIDFRSINMKFKKTQVLKDINLAIKPGEFVTFVGPSGCGKTTLLRVLAGLLRQSSGELYFNDKEVSSLPPIKRGIGMVFQSYALYPHLSVYNNLALGLKQAKLPKPEIKNRVHTTAKMLRLDELLKRYPSELSGGQRQRVAIGRAIARKPSVLLFDEPLSNLDAALRLAVRLEIGKLHRELGSTSIYVTHDQVEAMTLSDRMVVMNHGCIEQVGSPPEVYHLPNNVFVAQFLGSPKMSLLEVTYNRKQKKLIFSNEVSCSWSYPVNELGTQDDVSVFWGFRSEHIKVKKQSKELKKSEPKLLGVIENIENLCEELILGIRIQDGIKVVKSENSESQNDLEKLENNIDFSDLVMIKVRQTNFKLGDPIEILLEGKGYLFDSQTGNRISLSPNLSH